MSSLWDEFDDDDGQQTGAIESGSKDLAAITPGQLVLFEANQEKSIIKTTYEFADSLKSCEDIVIAVYRVADYTPAFRNNEQSKFWKETVSKEYLLVLFLIFMKFLKQFNLDIFGNY